MFGGIFDALGLGDKQLPGYQSPFQGQRNDFINRMGPAARNDVNFYTQNQGQRHGALQSAFGYLDPKNNYSLAKGMGDRMMRQAPRYGQVNARRLRNQGYGEGVQQGAMLDSQNHANEGANNILLQLLSPERMASQSMAQAGIYSPENMLGGLQYLMQMMGQADNAGMQEFQTRRTEPGFLTNIMSAAGGIAPFMSGGGGGGSSSSQGTNYDMLWNTRRDA